MSQFPVLAPQADPFPWLETDTGQYGLGEEYKAQLVQWLYTYVAPQFWSQVSQAMHTAWSNRDSGTPDAWMQQVIAGGQSYLDQNPKAMSTGQPLDMTTTTATPPGYQAGAKTAADQNALTAPTATDTTPQNGGAGITQQPGFQPPTPGFAPYDSVPPFMGTDTGANTMWTEASATLGYDALKHYTEYTASLGATEMYGDVGRRAGQSPTTPLDPEAWIQQQYKNSVGPFYQVIEFYANQYELDNGGPMPADLFAKLTTAVQNMPFSEQNQMMQALQNVNAYVDITTGGFKQKKPGAAQDPNFNSALQMLEKNPALGDIVAQYETVHQTKGYEQKAEQAFVSNYYASTGVMPTSQQIAEWGHQATEAQQEYISQQRYQDTGLTVGQYQNQVGRVDKLWGTYFPNKTPTQQDYVFAATKPGQSYNDWVYNHPSNYDGLTIGQNAGLTNAMDQISQKLWGTNSNPDMLKTVLSSVQPDAPKPA